MFLNTFFMLKDSAYPFIVVLAITIAPLWWAMIGDAICLQALSLRVLLGFEAKLPSHFSRRASKAERQLHIDGMYLLLLSTIVLPRNC